MHASATTRGSALLLRFLFLAALVLGRALVAQPLDTGLNLGANAEIFSVALQADGKIVVGGNFSSIGGIPRSRLARFNPDGTLDPSFNPNASTTVWVVHVQPDGKILVGGDFITMGGIPRTRLARLNPDGSVDAEVSLGANGLVRDILVQPDGRILVVGSFTQLAGANRTGVGRLNPDGTLDAAFNPVLAGTNTSAAPFVEALARLPNGQILIGGNFATVNNQSSAGAARLNVDGTRDPAFTPSATSDVSSFAVLPNGQFLMGGSFSRVYGESRPYLARFNADGSLDRTAPAPPNAGVSSLAVMPDGRILVGGSFTEVGPVRRTRIARLQPDTSLDTQFFPDVSGSLGGSTPGVYSIAVTGTGQVVIGGSFSSVAGAGRSGIARFGSPLPAITTAPRDLFVSAGATVTFSVEATGENLRYQWKRDGVDLVAATSATLRLTNVQTASAGGYTVSVSNSLGTVISPSATLSLGTPPATTYTVTTVAGTAGLSGTSQATGPNARFTRLLGIAAAADGTLFVQDLNLVREISPTGFAGTHSGIAGWALALDSAGNLFAADADARIAKITRAGLVTNYAGSGTRGTADGPAATAQFSMPRGVTVDRAGNVYVADSENLTIRKITPAGIVSTLAGLAGAQGVVDGTGSAARFHYPWSIAADAAGDLYVADRIAVRKVTAAGVVTTIAPVGSVDDAIGIAVDGGGNVFVADVTAHVIRRISTAGQITTIAGLERTSGSADGIGSAARFFSPWNLATDPSGNVFITDNGNNTVRKAAPNAAPLFINAAPTPQHATAGSPFTISVAAAGTALRYQWSRNGVVIPGATQSAYTVASASGADMGYYTVEVGNGGSATETTPTIVTVSTPGVAGRLINVATRGFVPAGEALTPGFVLRGSGSKPLVIRGVGPTLLNFGIGGSLADPRLAVAPLGGATLLSNDDWSGDLANAFVSVGAFALPAGSRDAALLANVSAAGSSAYTARITAPDATGSGIALAEVYDPEPLSSPVQLANVSTRGFVGVGANALVPGFVIGGAGPVQLLIRAVGPGLTQFGVTDVLADPQLTVVPLGRELVVASNDNWGGNPALSAAFAAAGAFPLPTGSRDAAVLVRLPPGAYTVVVSGVNNTTGVALVEIYDVP